jgi:hypothetical protein
VALVTITVFAYPLGFLLLPEAASVGIILMVQKRDCSSSSADNGVAPVNSDSKSPRNKYWARRIIATVSLVIMFSPVGAAYLLPPAPGNEGGSGSMTYLFGLIITIAKGAGDLIIARFIGILAM